MSDCNQCGKTFSEAQGKRGRKRKYCSRVCKQRHDVFARGGIPGGDKKVAAVSAVELCVECGRLFHAWYVGQKYCSRSCYGVSRQKASGPGVYWCSACETKKQEHEFRLKKSSNRMVPRSQCRDCENKAHAERKRSIEYKVKRQTRQRARSQQDIRYRLDRNMGRNISVALSRGSEKAGRSWEALVGYTTEELKRHLQKKFKRGMTWENYGSEWHIDHVVPKSVFNYSEAEHPDFKRCWGLKNLQPMFAKENIQKSNSISRPFQPLLALAWR